MHKPGAVIRTMLTSLTNATDHSGYIPQLPIYALMRFMAKRWGLIVDAKHSQDCEETL